MTNLDIAFTDGSTSPDFEADPPTLVGVPAPASSVAPTSPPQQSARAHAGAREFEGAQVGMSEIKITGVCAIEVNDDVTVTLDDLVRAVGVYRVVKVLHYVHPKTGELVRQQVLKPVETLTVVPFDSSNPNDDGIVRARP